MMTSKDGLDWLECLCVFIILGERRAWNFDVAGVVS
jgi:hypothetical protein